MARISCGHCGETHASVAEVRSCAGTNPAPVDHAAQPDGAADGQSTHPVRSPVAAGARPTSAPSRAGGASPADEPPLAQPTASHAALPSLAPDIDAAALAGPDHLGRSLLIGPDHAVPGPWRDAPERSADADASAETIEELHRAWRTRTRLVIRWSGPLPGANPTLRIPFHEWAVDQEIPGERLRFAVTANTVNCLDGRPSFEPLQLAIGLGATPTTAEADGTNGPGNTDGPGNAGDVQLADGREAHVDGGPLDLDLPARVSGAAIIPRVHLVSGSLRPMSGRSGAGADLAADQLEAVEHQTGPARILAPAGSGKTRVLTERARHLVDDCGIHGRAVSLVAYNRRAKEEMRDRLRDVPGLDIRTLNSLALAIATSSGPFRTTGGDGRDGPRTIGELDVRRLLDRVVPGRRRKKLTDPLEPWVDALSACRLGLRDPDEVEQAYGGDVAGFADVLTEYRRQLVAANALDFDEQILRAIERLLTEPDTRAIARAVTPMLLVDEFQDLTPAHLLLIRTIAGPAAEIFGVGDDDQTIYGYAGASPDWLIHFARFFPGAADHRLTVNYRCPPSVVAGAVNLLSHNRHRVTKEIQAGTADRRAGNGAGDDGVRSAGADGAAGLVILSAGDPQENLVAHVDKLVAGGTAPEDIAVLTRVNAALLPAAVYLANAGIGAVRPFGLGPDVLERSGVGAALSWLRLAVAPERGLASDDLRLALRRPPRSLHPRITDWACEQGSVKDLVALSERLNREKEADAIAEFAADIKMLRDAAAAGATTEDLLETVNSQIGLLGAASQLDRSQRSARRAAHADELAALSAVGRLYPNPETFEAELRTALAAIPIFDPEEPQPGVTLATIHTTKGLEWPHVVVHDVRDGLHPHRLSEDVEEERRIFHVGVTRGRTSVLVTVSGPPSPFVAELKEPRPADQAWPDEAPETLFVSRTGAAGSAGGKKATKPDRADPASAEEAALRDALTDWRRQRSAADGVPAYVVLDNKTLDAIAAATPTDFGELGAISGIGPAKLERYGADILGIVAAAGGG
ncbi:MAG: UvrD-helicase domain-containing protein [Actinomycetota bacterium]